MSQINEEKYSCHNPRLLVTGLLVAFGGLMICGVIALSVLLIIGFLKQITAIAVEARWDVINTQFAPYWVLSQ